MPPRDRGPLTDYSVLTLTSAAANTQFIEKGLGFWARGLVIDNFTNQWLLVREVYAFVAPFTAARQIPVGQCQKFTIVIAAPQGFPQPAIIPKQQAVIRYTEDPVPATPGVPVAPPNTVTYIASLATDQPALGFTATDTNGGAHFPVATGIIYFGIMTIRAQAATISDVQAVAHGLTSGAVINLLDLQNVATTITQAIALSFIPGIALKNLLLSDTQFDIGVNVGGSGTSIFMRGYVGLTF